MIKIATHDSATGEKPKNFLSWLLIPFARTQSKTIKQQYEAGCTSFDIRVKEDGDKWHCAHGPFKTKRSADDILAEINSFGTIKCPMLVCVTYEGKATNNKAFMDKVKDWKGKYLNIIWGGIAVKYGDSSDWNKVQYSYLHLGEEGYETGDQGFLPLDGRSWHIYLPIPWLWDRIYKRPHQFNETTYNFVDFL